TDLDPLGKRDIFNIAKKLRKDNMTMIIAEHETEETLAADKIIVLNDGEICGTGTPREILSQIEFLRENAIKPLQITEFFQPYFDKDELPLTVEQGLKAWDDLNFSINPGKYENLVEKDLKKEKKYGDPVVEVENLGHVYEGGVEALKDASFEIKKGEFVAVVGQNGSGKTTLVKHLNGLLKPTSGKVIIDGEDTKSQTLRQLSRKVGYVFQNPDHQIFEETVFDEVAFGPELQGQSEEEIKKNVNEALESVALKEFSDEDPFSLSKGERQRVAVASILATQPEVIILDEPTTGLDYHQIESMMKLITNLNKAGHTIIMVTHTMWVVAKYAHRAIVLKDGEIILNDRIRKVFEKEDVLNNAFLKPPQIVQFSNKLDNTVLTVDELKQIAERGD
ncbi:MAG: ATP-binding cassette domain-containing protein, partial [Halanaerobiales bacterium]